MYKDIQEDLMEHINVTGHPGILRGPLQCFEIDKSFEEFRAIFPMT